MISNPGWLQEPPAAETLSNAFVNPDMVETCFDLTRFHEFMVQLNMTWVQIYWKVDLHSGRKGEALIKGKMIPETGGNGRLMIKKLGKVEGD